MVHDYHYISKHDPKVKAAYKDLIQLLREVQNELRKDFTFQYRIVGSYSRDMITYDAKGNRGYDFDVDIYPNNYEGTAMCTSKELTAFEFLFGLGKSWAEKFPCLKFASKNEDDEVN